MPPLLDLAQQLWSLASATFSRRSPCWISMSPSRIAIHQSSGSILAKASAPDAQWDWPSALTALQTLWNDIPIKHRAVKVVLSDHWVRCMALPLPSGMRHEEEIHRWLQAEFKQRFSEDGSAWWMDWAVVGMSVVLVACPQALAQGLRQALADRHGSLSLLSSQSLETFFCIYPNVPSNRWIAVVSPHSLSMACIQEGRLSGYWSHPLNQPNVNDLAVRLDRHSRLLATDIRTIDVIDPGKILERELVFNTLQASGWGVQTPHLPTTPSVSTAHWTQFVGSALA